MLCSFCSRVLDPFSLLLVFPSLYRGGCHQQCILHQIVVPAPPPNDHTSGIYMSELLGVLGIRRDRLGFLHKEVLYALRLASSVHYSMPNVAMSGIRQLV